MIRDVPCRLSTCKPLEDGTFSVVCTTVRSFFVYRFVSPHRPSANFLLSGEVVNDGRDVYETVVAQAKIPLRQRHLWRYGFVKDAAWRASEYSGPVRKPVETVDAPKAEPVAGQTDFESLLD